MKYSLLLGCSFRCQIKSITGIRTHAHPIWMTKKPTFCSSTCSRSTCLGFPKAWKRRKTGGRATSWRGCSPTSPSPGNRLRSRSTRPRPPAAAAATPSCGNARLQARGRFWAWAIRWRSGSLTCRWSAGWTSGTRWWTWPATMTGSSPTSRSTRSSRRPLTRGLHSSATEASWSGFSCRDLGMLRLLRVRVTLWPRRVTGLWYLLLVLNTY